MDTILRKVKIFQFLSIDISLGSVVLCAFIGEIFNLRFSFAELSSLALTVFIIYNTDHLIDGQKSKSLILSERRLFFITHKVKIISLMSIALLGLMLILTWLQTSVIINGIILGLIVISYFISVHFGFKKLYHKEISGALIYSLGIFLLPFSHIQSIPSTSFFILFCQVFTLALLNLFVFAFYDREKDIAENQLSIALVLNRVKMERIIQALGLISCLVPVSVLFYTSNINQQLVPQLLILLMSLGTISLIRYMHFFKRLNLYRTFGDTLFFLPLLYFL